MKGEVEGGELVWWVPKAPTGGETDEEMEPPVHPAKDNRQIGEASNWDAFCVEMSLDVELWIGNIWDQPESCWRRLRFDFRR